MDSPFGPRLRELRISKGFSQESLARASDVSGFTISKYERGILREPHRETLDRLAAALGVSPSELLGIDPTPNAAA